MIKQLITDIAYDNITLSQALTRAKLISSRVNNTTFKNWLAKELEGYNFQDDFLPDYRKIRCVTYLTMELPFGRTHTFPVSFEDETDKRFLDVMLYHRAIAPISIIEKNIEGLSTAKGNIPMTPEQVELVGKPYQQHIDSYNGVLRSGYWEIGKGHLLNIIELTKQKLLDTLLDLDKGFPNLTNEFTMTKENEEKVQNIITNHIYGDNNPMNIAAGKKVEQNNNSPIIKKEDEEKLTSYGVTEEDIIKLKDILEKNAGDKPTLTGKAMKWLGGVTASVAGRGLYDHIPAITDFIHKLTT
jgi:hypothetical protein